MVELPRLRLLSLRRAFSGDATAAPLLYRIGIVGSGPAGFYAAAHLLKSHPNVSVDIYERLPVPYGLVRFGVAPDHPEVKNVINKFESVAKDPRFRFFGNVTIGPDHLRLETLRRAYHAVILAYGAPEDQKLNIPNEDNPFVFSARSFVSWYNGHPEAKNFEFKLDTFDTVAIVGIGNVALDCARILLTNVDVLKKTDISGHALDALQKSRVRNVRLVARRGPLQAAFTTKELREMVNLPGVRFRTDVDLVRSQIEKFPIFANDRIRKRQLDLILKSASVDAISASEKSWHLDFCRTPMEIIQQSTGELSGLRAAVNDLKTSADGHIRAIVTDRTEVVHCGAVMRSIGYRGTPLGTVQFDAKNGVIPNDKGRVLGPPSRSGRLYAAGWIKRGPTGVIATTMNDAIETATTVLEDLPSLKAPEPEHVAELDRALAKTPVVDFEGWKRIDELEQKLGASRGKEREKLLSVKHMLKVARGVVKRK
ncbi:hypothetical protein BJ742DRAFT_814860 [Cladochytrium replicatum]|nr:hypothetical protein BJ742DRAFT_814860 [Cladochytrium replicatum]